MEWTAHQISFRLLSPMHIGWRKSGNLQQTRPYVTGRSLWGALTARLTRESGQVNYEKVGEQVDERLAFTYLYPSTKSDQVTLWPWGEDWDEFAWMYLGSYVSTALADGHGAEEGSLHETEFISPRTRDGRRVYLTGYIFVRDDFGVLPLKSTLSKLQIGGERGYGWGRLAQEIGYGEKIIKNGDPCFQGFQLAGGTGRPILEAMSSATSLLAHITIDGESAAGEIEPLIGRETDTAGKYGQMTSKPEICLKPGTTLMPSARFSIEPKGLWKKLP